MSLSYMQLQERQRAGLGIDGRQISSACRAEMHACCDDWDVCGCWICHKVCEACNTQCRAVYDIPGGMEVCSKCYKLMSPPPGRTTSCEECQHPNAYRYPGFGDDRFLCPGCHADAGHLRKQDRGE